MSQELDILRHLAKGKTLTPLEALRRFGCLRLGARVFELRRQRWPIERRMVDVGNGKRVAQYHIPKAKQCRSKRR